MIVFRLMENVYKILTSFRSDRNQIFIDEVGRLRKVLNARI